MSSLLIQSEAGNTGSMTRRLKVDDHKLDWFGMPAKSENTYCSLPVPPIPNSKLASAGCLWFGVKNEKTLWPPPEIKHFGPLQ